MSTENRKMRVRNDQNESVKPQPITIEEAKRLGLDQNIKPFVPFVEDLRKQTPTIIVAECVSKLGDVFFLQNKTHLQKLSRKRHYVMSISLYQQLYFDVQRGMRVLRPSDKLFTKIYKPYTGQDLSKKKLLVMRTGGIGDLLFIQPNLIYLKEKYPDCKITFACGPQYKSMVETWDCIDNVVDLPVDRAHFYQSDYHAIFEGVIERCREAERINAYRLFTDWMGLNLPDERLVPKQEAKSEEREKCISILNNWGLTENNFIVVQPKASSPIRTPRPELWVKILNELTKLDYNILLTDNPLTKGYIDKLIDSCENKNRLFNFAQHSSEISSTIALVSLSKGVVSVDSALNHIAASFGKPIFGIFGPFTGNLRLSTYKNCDWIDVQDECAPCYRHGQFVCDHNRDGFPICFDNLDIEDCIKRIERVINNVQDIPNVQEQVVDHNKVCDSSDQALNNTI